MKKTISTFILVLASGTILFSQIPDKAIKKREKAKEKFADGKYEDAEEILLPLVKEYDYSGTCWDVLCQVKYAQYLKAKKEGNLFGNMTVTVKGKDGKESKDDSLAMALVNVMKDIGSGKTQYKNFMNTCREATLKCGNAVMASILLRATNIDEHVDTAIKTEAYDAFEEAEKYFAKQNFDQAKKYYKKAADLDTTFYKARLYLGDAYYGNKEYAEAAKYFKQAVKVKPNLQEPRKYLVDALMYLEEFGHAQTECIKTLMIYPDVNMFEKLRDIATARSKKFDRLWAPRPLYPNINETQTYSGADKAWQTYLDALTEIKPFCNAKGVIEKTTTLTTLKSAEVYAWTKMLKAAPADRFPEARKLQEAGYLDCYVLFSLYHFDLQGQFKFMVNQNPDHLENYVDILMGM